MKLNIFLQQNKPSLKILKLDYDTIFF